MGKCVFCETDVSCSSSSVKAEMRNYRRERKTDEKVRKRMRMREGLHSVVTLNFTSALCDLEEE